MKDYISRPLYMKKILPYVDKDLIKVLIGQRRTGKSYLLYEIMDFLQKERGYKKDNIIYINKEWGAFKDINDSEDLFLYLEKNKKKGKMALFIDEVQDIFEFEKVLRSLHAEGGWDVYISGSNAHLLSSDLATFLTGRYIEIEIFPLSFNEFLNFHGLEFGSESFDKYVKYGGLPYLIHLDLEDDIVYPYLRNVYDSILLKDVVKRFSVRNVSFLQRLILFLAEHVGSVVSAKKISDFLKKERVDISPRLILNYLEYLNSVFLVLEVKRRTLGKKIFEIGSKHFFNDTGIRNSLKPFESDDISKILENLVYMQLRREGYKVYVGSDVNMEIDFIAERFGKRKYIQVAYKLERDITVAREFGNLLSIEDNYEKILVSMDEMRGDYKGVKHVHIMDYLRMSETM